MHTDMHISTLTVIAQYYTTNILIHVHKTWTKAET